MIEEMQRDGTYNFAKGIISYPEANGYFE